MRNSQKRLPGEYLTYFITTNTQDSYPFFQEGLFCQLFVENLRLCKKLKQFELYAFAIMLEHVHLLIYPHEKFNISKIMQFLKRHFSRDMKFILTNEGEIRESRLQGGVESRLQGGEYNQFSETIRQHDETLKIIKEKFYNKYKFGQNIFPPFKWQQSFHDHVIRDERDFQHHYDYINFNPEKHGICQNAEKYPWSILNPRFHDLIDPAY